MIRLYLFYNHNNEQVFMLEYNGVKKLIHCSQFDFRQSGSTKTAIDLFFSFLDNFKRYVELKKGIVLEIENSEELYETVLKFYISSMSKNQPTKTDKLVRVV